MQARARTLSELPSGPSGPRWASDRGGSHHHQVLCCARRCLPPLVSCNPHHAACLLLLLFSQPMATLLSQAGE